LTQINGINETAALVGAQSLRASRSALGAFCRRFVPRLGKPKGLIATAHKLALLIYRLLKYGRDDADIGQEQYEKQFKERALRSLARKAKELAQLPHFSGSDPVFSIA
jgi:hypothetical protein